MKADGDPGVTCQSHSPTGSAPKSPWSVGAKNQDSEQLCGWGALRPRALQVFNSPYWVLLFLSVAAFLQGFIINGLVNIVVTTIERRFDLSSSQSGLIISSFDIATCICLPFVTYFGGNGHKPRWLGWGIGIMGLGSLVFALPHFTTPPYQATVPERSDMCPSNITDSSQHRASDGLSNYFYVFVLGQLLHGIGSTPLYTIGLTFLEENVKSSNGPVFMGIFYAVSIIGPFIGLLLGGYFLSLYSEITVETEMTPASPVWVGAWWIGFILGGALAIPVALVILSYPKKLPGSSLRNNVEADSKDTLVSFDAQTCQNKDGRLTSSPNTTFTTLLKDMPRSFLLLLRIPTFIFLCLASTALNGQTSSLSGFTAKYMESQFGLSSSEVGNFLSAMVFPVVVGVFIGSFCIKRFQLQSRGIIRFCVGSILLGLLSNLMFLVHCPNISMAGVTVEHGTLPGLRRSLVEDDLVAQCNTNCSCDRRQFSPVCGADDVTYYSPCLAGCSSINLTGSRSVYTDCSCVWTNASWIHGGSARPGKCVSSCSYMIVFMALYCVSVICNGLYIIPPITAILRCVPERQKSFALGVQGILVRTLGAIPGPIVLGSLIDQACLLKQSQDQGSCLLYENFEMSRSIFINCVIYRGSGTIFFILALLFLKNPSAPAPMKSPDSRTDLAKDKTNKALPEDGAEVTEQTCF